MKIQFAPLKILIAFSLAALTLTLATLVLNNRYQTEVQTNLAALTDLTRQAGEVVHQDFRDKMIGNDRSNIRLVLADANHVPGLQRVIVIGPSGHVYLDSWNRNLGQTLSTTYPGCAECHRQAEPPTATDLTLAPDLIRVATPINNDTRCTSCHVASTNANLGVILIDVSRTEIESTATRNWQIGLAIAISGAILLGGVAFWLAGRLPNPKLQWPLLPQVDPKTFWIATGSLVIGLVALSGGGWFTTQIEDDNAFCASCHTQPETAYYERTQTQAVDLASAHATENVTCIECHSGAGVVGRTGAVLQGAQNVVLFISRQYQQPAVLKNKIGDDSCVKCHVDVLESNGKNSHYHVYLPQWQLAQSESAAGCVTCHQGHVTGGAVDQAFLSEVAASAVCEGCHSAVK
jgi:hypothetical protein